MGGVFKNTSWIQQMGVHYISILFNFWKWNDSPRIERHTVVIRTQHMFWLNRTCTMSTWNKTVFNKCFAIVWWQSNTWWSNFACNFRKGMIFVTEWLIPLNTLLTVTWHEMTDRYIIVDIHISMSLNVMILLNLTPLNHAYLIFSWSK